MPYFPTHLVNLQFPDLLWLFGFSAAVSGPTSSLSETCRSLTTVLFTLFACFFIVALNELTAPCVPSSLPQCPLTWQNKWEGPEEPMQYLRAVVTRAAAIQVKDDLLLVYVHINTHTLSHLQLSESIVILQLSQDLCLQPLNRDEWQNFCGGTGSKDDLTGLRESSVV